ncbi:ubinuclein-1 isoform 3-T3 [Menidia menidia]
MDTMAESRRVQLTTLSCDASSPANKSASVSTACTDVPEAKEGGSDRPVDPNTVRLVLTLFEPDERTFPEFSYSQLVEKKISRTEDFQPSALEHNEEHDEISAIARKLEEKYGGKHKKKDRIQDLIDIGYGYDEEDSFIDNSEAYDEFVPSSITTKFGGFYVNSGMLQFRQASDTENEDFMAEERTFEPTKKRKLLGEQDKPKKKLCKASEEMEGYAHLKPSSLPESGRHEKIKIKKKRAVKTLSVTSMLKKFQREKDKERQRMAKSTAITGAAPPSLFPADAAGGGGSGLTDPLLCLIGSTTDHALIQAASTVDFDIDLDSLLDVSEDSLSPRSHPQTATEPRVLQNRADEQTHQDGASNMEVQVLNLGSNYQPVPHPEQTHVQSKPSSTAEQSAPLPEGLAPGLEDSIRKLMVAAKISEGESKLKFFNPEINSILLDIELQCQEQGGQLRSKVYRHMSSFMPCSKDTLFKRVKKLLISHVESPCLEDTLQKLKEAIGRSMPEQIACFSESCQAYEQVKTLKVTEEEHTEEKSGRKGGPKKLFKWNQEIRECLGHVLKERMNQSKDKGGPETEESLKSLLDNEVKPLWPKGWMQSRALMRESKKLLGLSTSLPMNKTKCLKGTSSISGASKLSDGCNHQGIPNLGEAPQRTDSILKAGSNMPKYLDSDGKQGDILKKGEVKPEFPALSSSFVGDKPPVNATSALTHLHLDVLANDAASHEKNLPLSPEVLAAAVAKHWSHGLDAKSPPPPPQSSPVDFPMGVSQVLPGLPQDGAGRHESPENVFEGVTRAQIFTRFDQLVSNIQKTIG